jgi:hypothetical protein
MKLPPRAPGEKELKDILNHTIVAVVGSWPDS